MALVKCPDCGKEVSSRSEKCIHCGCPLSNDEKVLEEPVIEEVKSTDDNEKKDNKKKLIIGLAIVGVVILIIIISMINKVKIPYIYGVTEENAISTLQINNLVPYIEYRYDDVVEEGKVIETLPSNGSRVNKNSNVTIIVSKGPSRITASNSTIEWYHIQNGNDTWSFYTPYIEEGYLYIECNPTFGTSFTWKSNGFGTASINDTFSKKVPVELIIDSNTVTANTIQNLKIKIPVNDLDVKKPTTLYVKLSALDQYGNDFDVNVNFSISW